MTFKIILAELEKELFPEFYPYYNNHFPVEKPLVNGNGDLSELTIKNIRFKLKTVRHSQHIEDSDVRKSLYLLFQKHVELFFDWRKEYDWYELRSILFLFSYLSRVKNFRELELSLSNTNVQRLTDKYFNHSK